MDNDKQIEKNLVSAARDRFLDIPLHPDEATVQTFAIEKEFEKSRKNRNLWIPFILFLFLAGLGILGTILIINIEADSKKLPASIADQFQDIKLKDILDTAKKQTNALETVRRSLTDVEIERDAKIKTVRQDATLEIDLISQSAGTEEEKQNQIILIRREAQVREARIRREYEVRITEKELEIKKVQDQLLDYENRLEKTDNARQDFVASEQRASEIEKQNLKKYYEERIREVQDTAARDLSAQRRGQEVIINLLKKNQKAELERLTLLYNPLFDDPKIQSILNASSSKLNSIEAEKQNFSLIQQESWAKKNYEDLKNDEQSIRTIFEKIKSIPFINSLPSAFKSIEQKSLDIFSRYEILWARTSSKILEKNRQIDQLNEIQEPLLSMINSYAGTVQENGFVIDPRDSQKLAVFIQKVFKVKTGDSAVVFRGDDEEIATIQFNLSGSGNIYARVITLKDITKPIRAFDRILLERK